MTSDELCFTPATALVPLIRRRKVSPLELIKAVLARIEKVNPSLNAYCTVAAEQALATARRATAALGKRGAVLGPLHGVPVSIKDLTPTQGHPHHLGLEGLRAPRAGGRRASWWSG